MHYDPIKRLLGRFFNQSTFLRALFYRFLDLLLLRTWYVHKEIRLWEKNASVDAYILDAGSGFGQYSYYLSQLNPAFTIYSVDIKQDQIEECKEFFKKCDLLNCTFEVKDLVTFKKENTFDLILSVDVMEHIIEDVQVFKNFYASLKPGGMLLISTPSDQGGSDVHHESDTSFIEEHVRNGYSIKEIEEKLRSAGFSKIETYYSYGWPGRISWLLSVKYPLLLLNLSKLFFILLVPYYVVVYPFAYLLNHLDIRLKHNSGTGLIVKTWK